MNRRLRLLLSAAVLTLCGACSTRPSSPEARIGIILPLTGPLAEMGFFERSAMELAQRQSRNSLPLVFEDSRSTALGAVNAANKLINSDRVQLLVTSTTGASLAVQPLAESANTPLVAFCMDPTITDHHESTIRFYIGIDEETMQLVNFLSTLPQTERVAILHAAVPVWRTAVQSMYVPALKKSFRSPPLVEEYDLQNKDFRSILGKIAANETTTLILLGYGFEYPPIFQQMDQLGLRSRIRRIIGGWGFLYTSLAPSQLEGVIVAGPQYVFERNTAGEDFAKQFQASIGRRANFDAAFAYELMTTLPVLRSAHSLSASSIKAGVRSLGHRSGVVGDYYFSARGDMVVKTGLGRYRSLVLMPFGREQ